MRLNIKTLKKDFQHFVWDTAEDQYPPLQRRFVIALRILYLLVCDLKEGQLNLRAMGLVYTTLLAMVPLIAVSFSVLKGFDVHNDKIQPLLLDFMKPLGEQGVEITNKIIGFVDNIKAGILGSLGLAFLIYTAVSLLQKIERAFNFTWRITTHRPLSQRFSDYITLILIGPVLIFSALGVTASVSNIDLLQKIMEVEAIGLVFNLIRYLVPFLLIVTVFTLVYKLVPNVYVKLKPAIIGAVVAGLLWETSSWAFTNFIVGSTKYTAIYSAFATLIIFMIWLYLNWLILLIGCSVAFYYQYPEQRTLRSRTVVLSNRLREKLSLYIMILVARHFYQHKPAWTLDALVKHLNISGEICDSLVNYLLQAGLLVRTADEKVTFVPGYAIERITVKDIISSVRKSGETENFSIESLPKDQVVNSIFSEIEDAINKQLDSKTLYELSLTHSNKP